MFYSFCECLCLTLKCYTSSNFLVQKALRKFLHKNHEKPRQVAVLGLKTFLVKIGHFLRDMECYYMRISILDTPKI